MIKIKLRDILKSRNMTQSELAELTSIRPSTICDLCNNNCTFIKLENIEKLCKILNCDLSDIMKFYKD